MRRKPHPHSSCLSIRFSIEDFEIWSDILKLGMVMSTEQTRTAPCVIHTTIFIQLFFCVIHTTDLTQTRPYAASEAACGRRDMERRNA